MHIMLRFQFFFFLMLMFVGQPVFAQDEATVRLIDDFQKAIKTQEKSVIMNAYYQLKENPQAIKYMEENFPKHFLVYRRYQLVERVESIQFTLGTVGDQPLGEQESGAKKSPGDNSNKDQVEANSNFNKRSNQEAVKDSSTQDRVRRNNISNSQRARRSANQSRASNSRRARTRR